MSPYSPHQWRPAQFPAANICIFKGFLRSSKSPFLLSEHVGVGAPLLRKSPNDNKNQYILFSWAQKQKSPEVAGQFLRDFWQPQAPPPPPSPHNSHIVLITHAPLCSLSFPFHFFYFYISLFCTCQTYFSQVLGSETISRRSQVEAVICFFSGTDKHRHYKPWTVNCLCLGALSSFW